MAVEGKTIMELDFASPKQASDTLVIAREGQNLRSTLGYLQFAEEGFSAALKTADGDRVEVGMDVPLTMRSESGRGIEISTLGGFYFGIATDGAVNITVPSPYAWVMSSGAVQVAFSEALFVVDHDGSASVNIRYDVPNPSHWASPNVSMWDREAITRLASAVYALRGNSPIP